MEFVAGDGRISLGSLKHKAVGDRLSDLSVDFWKSVRVWVNFYKSSGRVGSNARFILYSTASVSPDSFLQHFISGGSQNELRATEAAEALASSRSKEIAKVKKSQTSSCS